MKTFMLACRLTAFAAALGTGAVIAQQPAPPQGPPPFSVGNRLGLPINPAADGAFNPMSTNVKVYGAIYSAESCSYDPVRNLIVVPNRSVGQNVLRETVVWWLLVAAVGSYVLVKTRWGNWIFAVGGNKEAARAVGVPANQVKVGLFVCVSLCGCLAGTLIALRYGTVQANQGTGLEFEYIIAAVVGGCLLTGGYGSVIGAGLGSAIMAVSVVGVQTTKWNSDGRFAFLGGVLLLAVLVNNFTRKKAQEAR